MLEHMGLNPEGLLTLGPFSIVNITVLYDLRLVESETHNRRYGGTAISNMQIFFTAWWMGIFKTCVVQGSTVV